MHVKAAAFGKTVVSVKDLVAIVGQMLEAAETEIAFLIPPSVLSYASQFALARESAKKIVTNGGHVRGITNISFYYIDAVRQLLDIGEDVRHVDNSQEGLIFVRDEMESVSSINAVTNELLLDDQIVAFWSEDPTYAEYLLSSFERAWAEAVPAAERIQELVEQSSHQV